MSQLTGINQTNNAEQRKVRSFWEEQNSNTEILTKNYSLAQSKRENEHGYVETNVWVRVRIYGA